MMEVAVSLFVFALLLTCLGMTLNHFGKINKYLLAKQQCTAAAQGMLDSIAVRGEKISAEDIQRLWPNVSLSVQHSDGSGQWEGLELVKVTAIDKSAVKEVKIELCKYILPRKGG